MWVRRDEWERLLREVELWRSRYLDLVDMIMKTYLSTPPVPSASPTPEEWHEVIGPHVVPDVNAIHDAIRRRVEDIRAALSSRFGG
jgi:hypothetical protein